MANRVSVGKNANTTATLLLRERHVLSETRFVDIVVWRLPTPSVGGHHVFKYRLAYIADSKCVLRYDNESGKGDHKHIGELEVPYSFNDVGTLIVDFWKDVEGRGAS